MSDLLIIPWGRTDWGDARRLIGRTDLPLNDAGRAQVDDWAAQLLDAPPALLQYGPEEAARETARLLSRRLGLRSGRPIGDLAEMDVGLWAGLTPADVEQRFTSAYDDWRNSPESVCPPEGEPVADALRRIERAAQRSLRKHAQSRVGFVVGPMAAAALRCKLEEGAMERFWEYVDAPAAPYRLTWPRATQAAGTGS